MRAHFEAGRDVTDTTPPAAPAGLTATAGLGQVTLDWADATDTVDGYDVYRATVAGGPYTRINASRLFASAYTDTAVSGGTTYHYAVTASDVANHRSAYSDEAAATPPSTEELLGRYAPVLRYETQESYFADSAAEMTDNYVTGRRENSLVGADGSRIAAADPADPLPQLTLGFLADQQYANGATATNSTTSTPPTAPTSRTPSGCVPPATGIAPTGASSSRRARRGCSTGSSTTTTRRTSSASACTRATGSRSRSASTPTACPTPPSTPSTATVSAAPGARSSAAAARRWSTSRSPRTPPTSARASTARDLPDDYHRGTGLAVRPGLEVVTTAPGFLAWRGRWGGSSSSPVAPRRQAKWTNPSAFAADASACTVGAVQAHASAVAARAAVPAPRLRVVRDGGRVTVRYRFGRASGRDRPHTLLVSVTAPGDPGAAVARRVRVVRGGTLVMRARGSVVRASAFSRRGARSRLVTVVLP